MATVAFHTLGCKVNSYESEAMLEIFKKRGYETIDFESPADIYVINTCTVTNTGDSKSRQMIRKAHRTNPEAVICVVGCYSQVASEEITGIEGVSVVLGTQHRASIVDFVEEYKSTHKQIVKIENVMKVSRFEDLSIHAFENKTRAFLKIQDGCNNFCTYCIVPYVRGRERSREPKDIINEVKKLAEQGYKEITLLGQNVNSYLRNEKEKGIEFEQYEGVNSFATLLRAINKIDGIERIRFVSPHPKDFTDDVIEAIRNCEKVCKLVHLPLQSGSSEVLKVMNRKYTKEQYLNLVDKIREKIPNVRFTTDIIVGFPGETEEEFNETYEFLKEIKFYKMHIFKYSPRKGTKAAQMKQQIDGAKKEERSHKLIELSDENEKSYNKKYVGKTVEVLFEEKKDNYYKGHTKNYLLAYLSEENVKDIKIENQIIKVKCIEGTKEHILVEM